MCLIMLRSLRRFLVWKLMIIQKQFLNSYYQIFFIYFHLNYIIIKNLIKRSAKQSKIKRQKSMSLFEVWWTGLECTVWFWCIHTNLPKPYSVVALCLPYLKKAYCKKVTTLHISGEYTIISNAHSKTI